MKAINKTLIYLFTATIIISYGCAKKLVEKPHTVFSTEYFKTPTGFQNGINALYSGLRYLYGPEGATALANVGTDEFTFAEQPRNGAGGTADVLTLGSYTLDPANGALLTPWNRSFNNINLANGLIGFSESVDIPETTKNNSLGQIRFLRALYYLNLVQYFGAVPLDLGSGDLMFNQEPFQGFNRANTTELLAKNYDAIIQDLIFATQNLSDKRPASAFVAAKPAAYHLLAKAYLFRAYSSAKQADDFNKAYAAAMEVINNQSKYGVALLQNYADVNRPKNDYNAEILFSVERLPGNFPVNEVTNPTGIGGDKGIDAANDFVGDYTAVTAPLISSSTKPVSTRTILYGRPIRRFCPTPWLYNVAFSDKQYDSRYEGSFRTVYIASTTGDGFTANVDTGFVLALTNRIADSLNGISPAGPRLKPYRVIAPKEFYFLGGSVAASVTQNMYPSLSKYEDPDKIDANNRGTRPFPVAKLSETYLLAAEAAVQLNNQAEAFNLVKTLRERAAFRTNPENISLAVRKEYVMKHNTGTETAPNWVNYTASDMTLDFILDERTRELAGESMRWGDLAVRGKLIDRVKLYNSDGAPKIQPFHQLRPIPQSHLNNVVGDNPKQYQNPGYN